MSPIRIAILATDGVFAATLMQARDFFHMAGLRHSKQQGLGPTSAFQIRVVSPDGQAVTSFSEAVIPVDGHLGEAEVIILRPLSFFRVNDLDFGDIVASGTAGTVRLAPDGTRSRTGGATLAGNGGEPARFAGLGTPNRQVNISLGSNTIWITGPGPRMRVRDFEIGSTPTAILSTTPTRFTIASALGNYNFPVGATLEVGANQTPGDYSGTFNVTANYQ